MSGTLVPDPFDPNRRVSGDPNPLGHAANGHDRDDPLISLPAAPVARSRIRFTIFKTNGSRLSKQYRLAADGSVETNSGTQFAQGRYRVVDFDAGDPAGALVEIGRELEGLSSNQAIGLGVPLDGTITGRIVTKDRHTKGGTDAIPRSLEYFGWPSGPGLLLLDGDEIDGLPAVLCELYPPFADVALLRRPSASSSVINPRTGKALKTGEHVYVIVDDPTLSKDCLEALMRLSWCCGSGKAAGWVKLSKCGAVLVRGPVDASVGSPERLSYEGKAVVDDGLARLPRAAQVIGGKGVLCADNLLAFAAQAAPAEQYQARVDAAKNEPEFCARQAEVRATYRAEHIRMAVARGVPREKAEAAYDKALAAGTSKSGNWTFVPLTSEHVLYWPDGKSFTIADIQKDRTAFHRKECCDPVEGTSYQSLNCAIIYSVGKRIEIYSRAHGDAFAYVAPLDDIALPLAELLAQVREAHSGASNAGSGAAAGGAPGAPSPRLVATPYVWTDPEKIPMRDWLYGRLLVRKFVTATVAPGGLGKSSLIAAEAVAQVSGMNLIGVRPKEPLRVWLCNLEDPQEETQRKVQAVALHYGLGREAIGNRLFVDSGRDQSFVVATMTREGPTIVRTVVDALVAEIIDKQIDVLIIDPFVSCHEVPENDNTAQDMVVKEWGKVAELGNCAVHLVDHTRKMGSSEAEVTTETSRGAKAKTDACRVVRAVSRMTKEEGEKAGVENHRLHFRTYNDKANLAPPADRSDWFKLESVDLGNGPAVTIGVLGDGIRLDAAAGDSVGVVTQWNWPDAMAGVTDADFAKVAAEIRTGEWRENPQAGDWVGKAVAKALKLNLDDKADKAKVAGMIKVWVGRGALVEVNKPDKRRKVKTFIEVAEEV